MAFASELSTDIDEEIRPPLSEQEKEQNKKDVETRKAKENAEVVGISSGETVANIFLPKFENLFQEYEFIAPSMFANQFQVVTLEGRQYFKYIGNSIGRSLMIDIPGYLNDGTLTIYVDLVTGDLGLSRDALSYFYRNGFVKDDRVFEFKVGEKIRKCLKFSKIIDKQKAETALQLQEA